MLAYTITFHPKALINFWMRGRSPGFPGFYLPSHPAMQDNGL
jgi:hypothetical protein